METTEGKYLIIIRHGGIDSRTRELRLQERSYLESVGRVLRPMIHRHERLPLHRATVRMLISPAPLILSSLEALSRGIEAESASQWMIQSIPSLWDVGSTDSTYQDAARAVLQALREYEIVIVLTHGPIRARLPEMLYAPLNFNIEAANRARNESRSSDTFPLLIDIERQRAQRISPH